MSKEVETTEKDTQPPPPPNKNKVSSPIYENVYDPPNRVPTAPKILGYSYRFSTDIEGHHKDPMEYSKFAPALFFSRSSIHNALRLSEKSGVVGIPNMGNTCYMAAALQALFHCPSLMSLILSHSWPQAHNILSSDPRVRLYSAFQRLFAYNWLGQYTSPRELRDALIVIYPYFRGNDQHDSQELFHCLLDALQEVASYELRSEDIYEQYQTLQLPLGLAPTTIPPPLHQSHRTSSCGDHNNTSSTAVQQSTNDITGTTPDVPNVPNSITETTTSPPEATQNARGDTVIPTANPGSTPTPAQDKGDPVPIKPPLEYDDGGHTPGPSLTEKQQQHVHAILAKAQTFALPSPPPCNEDVIQQQPAQPHRNTTSISSDPSAMIDDDPTKPPPSQSPFLTPQVAPRPAHITPTDSQVPPLDEVRSLTAPDNPTRLSIDDGPPELTLPQSPYKSDPDQLPQSSMTSPTQDLIMGDTDHGPSHDNPPPAPQPSPHLPTTTTASSDPPSQSEHLSATSILSPPPATPPQPKDFPKLLTNPIGDIFSGSFISEVTCSRCHTVTSRTEAFLNLPLELPTDQHLARTEAERNVQITPQLTFFRKVSTWAGITRRNLTLDACLHAFCAADVLNKDNKYHCNTCATKVNAKRHTTILTPPNVLCIQLKRFTPYGKKVDDSITCPVEGLDIAPYLHHSHPLSTNYTFTQPNISHQNSQPQTTQSQTSRGELMVQNPHTTLSSSSPLSPASSVTILTEPALVSNRETLYDLFAIIIHAGSLHSGHYTCYAKHPITGQWFYYNDSTCTPVDDEAIASVDDGYIYFYQRRPNYEHRQLIMSIIQDGMKTIRQSGRPFFMNKPKPPMFPGDIAGQQQQGDGDGDELSLLFTKPLYFVPLTWITRALSLAEIPPVSCVELLCPHGLPYDGPSPVISSHALPSLEQVLMIANNNHANYVDVRHQHMLESSKTPPDQMAPSNITTDAKAPSPSTAQSSTHDKDTTPMKEKQPRKKDKASSRKKKKSSKTDHESSDKDEDPVDDQAKQRLQLQQQNSVDESALVTRAQKLIHSMNHPEYQSYLGPYQGRALLLPYDAIHRLITLFGRCGPVFSNSARIVLTRPTIASLDANKPPPIYIYPIGPFGRQALLTCPPCAKEQQARYERKLIHQVHQYSDKDPRRPRRPRLFAIIHRTWYDKWLAYVSYTPGKDGIIKRPPRPTTPVDNIPLFISFEAMKSADVITEQYKVCIAAAVKPATSEEPDWLYLNTYPYKPSLQFGQDYVTLPPPVFHCLIKLYGGGPYIIRKSHNLYDFRKLSRKLHPHWGMLQRIPPPPLPDPSLEEPLPPPPSEIDITELMDYELPPNFLKSVEPRLLQPRVFSPMSRIIYSSHLTPSMLQSNLPHPRPFIGATWNSQNSIHLKDPRMQYLWEYQNKISKLREEMRPKIIAQRVKAWKTQQRLLHKQQRLLRKQQRRAQKRHRKYGHTQHRSRLTPRGHKLEDEKKEPDNPDDYSHTRTKSHDSTLNHNNSKPEPYTPRFTLGRRKNGYLRSSLYDTIIEEGEELDTDSDGGGDDGNSTDSSQDRSHHPSPSLNLPSSTTPKKVLSAIAEDDTSSARSDLSPKKSLIFPRSILLSNPRRNRSPKEDTMQSLSAKNNKSPDFTIYPDTSETDIESTKSRKKIRWKTVTFNDSVMATEEDTDCIDVVVLTTLSTDTSEQFQPQRHNQKELHRQQPQLISQLILTKLISTSTPSQVDIFPPLHTNTSTLSATGDIDCTPEPQSLNKEQSTEEPCLELPYDDLDDDPEEQYYDNNAFSDYSEELYVQDYQLLPPSYHYSPEPLPPQDPDTQQPSLADIPAGPESYTPPSLSSSSLTVHTITSIDSMNDSPTHHNRRHHASSNGHYIRRYDEYNDSRRNNYNLSIDSIELSTDSEEDEWTPLSQIVPPSLPPPLPPSSSPPAPSHQKNLPKRLQSLRPRGVPETGSFRREPKIIRPQVLRHLLKTGPNVLPMPDKKNNHYINYEQPPQPLQPQPPEPILLIDELPVSRNKPIKPPATITSRGPVQNNNSIDKSDDTVGSVIVVDGDCDGDGDGDGYNDNDNDDNHTVSVQSDNGDGNVDDGQDEDEEDEEDENDDHAYNVHRIFHEFLDLSHYYSRSVLADYQKQLPRPITSIASLNAPPVHLDHVERCQISTYHPMNPSLVYCPPSVSSEPPPQYEQDSHDYVDHNISPHSVYTSSIPSSSFNTDEDRTVIDDLDMVSHDEYFALRSISDMMSLSQTSDDDDDDDDDDYDEPMNFHDYENRHLKSEFYAHLKALFNYSDHTYAFQYAQTIDEHGCPIFQSRMASACQFYQLQLDRYQEWLLQKQSEYDSDDEDEDSEDSDDDDSSVDSDDNGNHQQPDYEANQDEDDCDVTDIPRPIARPYYFIIQDETGIKLDYTIGYDYDYGFVARQFHRFYKRYQRKNKRRRTKKSPPPPPPQQQELPPSPQEQEQEQEQQLQQQLHHDEYNSDTHQFQDEYVQYNTDESIHHQHQHPQAYPDQYHYMPLHNYDDDDDYYDSSFSQEYAYDMDVEHLSSFPPIYQQQSHQQHQYHHQQHPKQSITYDSLHQPLHQVITSPAPLGFEPLDIFTSDLDDDPFDLDIFTNNQLAELPSHPYSLSFAPEYDFFVSTPLSSISETPEHLPTSIIETSPHRHPDPLSQSHSFTTSSCAPKLKTIPKSTSIHLTHPPLPVSSDNVEISDHNRDLVALHHNPIPHNQIASNCMTLSQHVAEPIPVNAVGTNPSDFSHQPSNKELNALTALSLSDVGDEFFDIFSLYHPIASSLMMSSQSSQLSFAQYESQGELQMSSDHESTQGKWIPYQMPFYESHSQGVPVYNQDHHQSHMDRHYYEALSIQNDYHDYYASSQIHQHNHHTSPHLHAICQFTDEIYQSPCHEYYYYTQAPPQYYTQYDPYSSLPRSINALLLSRGIDTYAHHYLYNQYVMYPEVIPSTLQKSNRHYRYRPYEDGVYIDNTQSYTHFLQQLDLDYQLLYSYHTFQPYFHPFHPTETRWAIPPYLKFEYLPDFYIPPPLSELKRYYSPFFKDSSSTYPPIYSNKRPIYITREVPAIRNSPPLFSVISDLLQKMRDRLVIKPKNKSGYGHTAVTNDIPSDYLHKDPRHPHHGHHVADFTFMHKLFPSPTSSNQPHSSSRTPLLDKDYTRVLLQYHPRHYDHWRYNPPIPSSALPLIPLLGFVDETDSKVHDLHFNQFMQVHEDEFMGDGNLDITTLQQHFDYNALWKNILPVHYHSLIDKNLRSSINERMQYEIAIKLYHMYPDLFHQYVIAEADNLRDYAMKGILRKEKEQERIHSLPNIRYGLPQPLSNVSLTSQ